MINDRPIALYVHIPFCVRRCPYCAFATYASEDAKLWDNYVEALCHEIKRWQGQARVKTTFFGGGTPSLLPARLLRRVVEAIHNSFPVQSCAEWTIEVHPSTCLGQQGLDKLTQLKDLGFNRFSFGVESLQEKTLSRLGRQYHFDNLVEIAKHCHHLDLTNFNFDLIAGWPWEGDNDFYDTIKGCLKLQPKHLSIYPLSIEDETPFGKQRLDIDRDNQADLCLWSDHYLTQLGWQHYEIANFSLLGFACKHNLVYWRYQDYLGVGLSASSKLMSRHFMNTNRLERYLDLYRKNQSPIEQQEQLTPHEIRKRQLIMALRLNEGVKEQDLLEQIAFSVYQDWRNSGRLTLEDGRCRLSPQGWLVANQLFCVMDNQRTTVSP